MAHPRATKKSGLTTTTTATTRQGKKQPRNRVVEEEAEELDDGTHGEDSDSEGLEESQGATSEPLQQLIGTMVGDQRKRFDARKQSVIDNYRNECKALKDSIDAIFDEHEQKSLSAHHAQLNRLRELLAQKAKVEVAMARKLASLRADYDAHSRDLEAVLNRRIMELG